MGATNFRFNMARNRVGFNGEYDAGFDESFDFLKSHSY